MSAAAAPAALRQLPLTYAERLGMDYEIRVPATLEEFLDFADRCDYRVEYSKGQLISMGNPTDIHELIVVNTASTLKTALRGKGAYKVYGSNLGVLIREADAHYKPDVTVLAEDPVFVFHKVKKRTLRSIVNPLAVVEILSEGTRSYDWSEKLPDYKKCPSLRYILLVDQFKPFVSVFSRTKHPKEWLSRDYEGLDEQFPIDGHLVSLHGIYEDVTFSNIGPKAAG